MNNFAVVGATSWGVTLTALLARGGHPVTLVTRTGGEADRVRAARGIARLPELRLPDTVEVAAIQAGQGQTFELKPAGAMIVAWRYRKE